MTREEKLTLDEFVTAPRKPAQRKPVETEVRHPSPHGAAPVPVASEPEPPGEDMGGRDAAHGLEARKALRRVKRERMKGAQNFVNVHLDRETKKRLKLASFTSEQSMQSIMERAIIKFLDDNGY